MEKRLSRRGWLFGALGGWLAGWLGAGRSGRTEASLPLPLADPAKPLWAGLAAAPVACVTYVYDASAEQTWPRCPSVTTYTYDIRPIDPDTKSPDDATRPGGELPEP